MKLSDIQFHYTTKTTSLMLVTGYCHSNVQIKLFLCKNHTGRVYCSQTLVVTFSSVRAAGTWQHLHIQKCCLPSYFKEHALLRLLEVCLLTVIMKWSKTNVCVVFVHCAIFHRETFCRNVVGKYRKPCIGNMCRKPCILNVC